MQDMHVAGVDLNLLVALDALLAERSVTRAAARVGLTQPAMSHALGRLRRLFDDPLLVRTAEGMSPTPRALGLVGPVRRGLAELETALAPAPTFDPKTARGRFVLAMGDYAEVVLLPGVVARLTREAPGMDLEVRPAAAPAFDALARGELDAVIGLPATGKVPEGIYEQRLFEERFVCVMRSAHPMAKRRLTLERFLALSHALISPRGERGGLLDTVLTRMGKTRRVALLVPHFLVAPHVIATSDLVLTLAERLARVLADPLKLVVRTPPLSLEGFAMAATWHARNHGDPAQRWFRRLLAEVGATV